MLKVAVDWERDINSWQQQYKKVLHIPVVVVRISWSWDLLTNDYFLITLSTSVAGHQYETRVSDTFVISSNDVLLSCSLPSFASEYLMVTAWVTSQGQEIVKSDSLGNQSSLDLVLYSSLSCTHLFVLFFHFNFLLFSLL